MTTPTPAAVRAALKAAHESCTVEEAHAFMQEKRYTEDILRDHIRAVAQEIRTEAIAMRVNAVDPFATGAERNAEIAEAQTLEKFADRLEGRASNEPHT